MLGSVFKSPAPADARWVRDVGQAACIEVQGHLCGLRVRIFTASPQSRCTDGRILSIVCRPPSWAWMISPVAEPGRFPAYDLVTAALTSNARRCIQAAALWLIERRRGDVKAPWGTPQTRAVAHTPSGHEPVRSLQDGPRACSPFVPSGPPPASSRHSARRRGSRRGHWPPHLYGPRVDRTPSSVGRSRESDFVRRS